MFTISVTMNPFVDAYFPSSVMEVSLFQGMQSMNHVHTDAEIVIPCIAAKKQLPLMYRSLLFQGVVLDQETFYADIDEANREVRKLLIQVEIGI